jgi:BirA family biotin operon repressor/biotin-[acetyl-CoA-carboxylase] ligase
MATPYVTAHLGEVPSTQDEARDRFAEIPVLVTAASQSAGRGRSNNEWWNAPRLVAASLAFEPSWPTANWPRLALVAGLAARDVLPGLWLKWPNDLVVRDGKVGGILAEADAEAVTVGLGLNLFWPDAPDGVGAAYGADPGEDAPTTIAEAWCESLLDRANADRDEWGLDQYREACVTLGADVQWEPGGSGRALDVDMDGALVVETSEGTITLRSGEVRTVRGATLVPEAKDKDAD